MTGWRLRRFLDEREISAYAVVARAEGRLSSNTVYRIARGETKQVEVLTLHHLIAVLRELTGEEVTVCDVLEYDDDQTTARSPRRFTAATGSK